MAAKNSLLKYLCTRDTYPNSMVLDTEIELDYQGYICYFNLIVPLSPTLSHIKKKSYVQ